MPANQFPTVITRAAGFWGTHLSDVSDADDFIGIVDTMELARTAGASRTQVHQEVMKHSMRLNKT